MSGAPPSPSARSSGVLLHPTALPGPGPNGTFGAAAQAWIRLLGQSGVGVWQLLPLAPTDGTGSPYSSPSGSALNPALLDGALLQQEGFIAADPAQLRGEALGPALLRCWPQQSEARKTEFRRWCRVERFWLRDHCRFMVLRNLQGGEPWWRWPAPLARRDRRALQRLHHDHHQALLQEALVQWQLQRQWQQLRGLAREQGVQLLGDLPFYVAHDSADGWSRPGLFSLGRGGSLEQQSGVPPDYFSATGQLWGTPVYRWPRHLLSGFRWWLQRLERQLELFDLLRLDHFRALQAFWSVPGADATAEHGVWKASPGWPLLALLWCRCALRGVLLGPAGRLGRLPLVAEDLGVITPPVERLRDGFGLPGMKILQFAFDGDPANPYLPANIRGSRWVVYTGTHDNATTIGWWRSLNGEARARVEAAVGAPVTAPGWQLLELALASSAELAVAPLQDLLELGDEARFNTPGTTEGNWCWRLARPMESLAGPLGGYGAMAARYGRGVAPAPTA
ncbi:4-alpha-glucanotransferase [Synechococcus sp. FGCU-3]|nr:4-alpha-glucanotransferase [Synechococcus sp. FGCU3]